MSDDSYIPLRGLVEELARLCADGSTGTLFIATKKNRSAQIMIEDGEIRYLYFFNKRGEDALPLMAEIVAGKFRFQEGSIPPMAGELPATQAILDYLRKAAGGGTTGARPQIVQPPAATEKPPPASGGIISLTQSQRQTLEQGLATYIGPMAMIVCEEHLDTVRDVASAIEALAAEIPSEEQAIRFRQEMQVQLLG